MSVRAFQVESLCGLNKLVLSPLARARSSFMVSLVQQSKTKHLTRQQVPLPAITQRENDRENPYARRRARHSLAIDFVFKTQEQ